MYNRYSSLTGKAYTIVVELKKKVCALTFEQGRGRPKSSLINRRNSIYDERKQVQYAEPYIKCPIPKNVFGRRYLVGDIISQQCEMQ